MCNLIYFPLTLQNLSIENYQKIRYNYVSIDRFANKSKFILENKIMEIEKNLYIINTNIKYYLT